MTVVVLRRTTVWALLVVTVLAIGHIRYLFFLCDDAFISFRYAENLASGNGIVFNVDERVEGYTNFLWVAIVGAGIALGQRPEQFAAPLGAAIAIAALFACVALALRRGRNPLVFATLVAGSSAWATWATGGLETSLFTALVTLAFFAVLPETGPSSAARRLAASSVLLALAALTRPEGILIAGSIGLHLATRAARRGAGAGALLAWTAGWAVPVALHFLWRHSYYGAWLPNTAAVKAHGAQLLPFGLAYLWDATRRLHLYFLPAVWFAQAVLRGPRSLLSERNALAVMIVVPYLAVVAASGGDFMDQFRFVVPVLPLLFWTANEALRDIVASTGRKGVVAATVLLVLFVGLNLAGSRRSTELWYARNQDSIGLLRKYVVDWSAVGKHLGEISAPSDSIAVTAAGCIPYYSHLYTIDQLGLIARDLAPYAERDPIRPGHRLLMRGDALMALRPQFVLGGPIVGRTPDQARFSPWVDESGRAALAAEYEVGVTAADADGEPRYYALAVRADIAERLR